VALVSGRRCQGILYATGLHVCCRYTEATLMRGIGSHRWPPFASKCTQCCQSILTFSYQSVVCRSFQLVSSMATSASIVRLRNCFVSEHSAVAVANRATEQPCTSDTQPLRGVHHLSLALDLKGGQVRCVRVSVCRCVLLSIAGL
jgi:hypothetical protein